MRCGKRHLKRQSLIRCRARSINSNEYTVQVGAFADRGINPVGKANEIAVHRADDNSRMRLILLMKPNKMPAVVSQQSATITFCEQKDFMVRPGSACMSCIRDGQHVMASLPEPHDNGERKILVRVQSRHTRSLGLFIVNDLRFNFAGVRAHICPGVGQIFGPERGIALQ
jgi:hypothetical protein